MSRYLITGGAGFIGCHLVEELLNQGQQIRVLDNLSTGQKENLSQQLGNIELIVGDIRDMPLVQEAMKGVDYVLHQAALPSVPRSIVGPLESHEVNATGTLNVLIAARDNGVKRLVYASSSSVYGNTAGNPKYESMPTHPLSPYAVSKLSGENYCRVFHLVYKIETVCLRYFNVFGPRQDSTSHYAAVIPRFLNALLNDQPLTIFGDGTQSRDFTYVDNVVEANLLACHASNVAGEVFNIACGEGLTVRELVRKLETALSRQAKLQFLQPRLGEVQHSVAAIDKASNCLQYVPKVSALQGIEYLTSLLVKDRNDSASANK